MRKDIQRATNFVEDALSFDAEEARSAGTIGYFARMLVQVTMPHSKQDSNEFTRRNGPLVLRMMAPTDVGLPYGTYPRLLMAWITTEAVKTKSRELELGRSLSEFMRRLDLGIHGGAHGTITTMRRQMRRLFSSTVSWSYEAGKNISLGGINPVEAADLWWDVKNPDQVAMWTSTISLNERFYREVVERPVPVNMTALKMLARERSPMALDIYNWLTYRMSYVRKDQLVPWDLLQLQFGGDYKHTRQFKAKFLQRLKLVKTVYPKAKVASGDEGLILSPSPSHVPYAAVRPVQSLP